MPSCNDCGACDCNCSTRVVTVKDDPELRLEYEKKQKLLQDKINEVNSLRELLIKNIHSVNDIDKSIRNQVAIVFDIWRTHGKCSRIIVNTSSDSGKLIYCSQCPLISKCGNKNKVNERIVLASSISWLEEKGINVKGIE